MATLPLSAHGSRETEIYLFGFSRGAYTVRCIANILECAGIPTKQEGGQALSRTFHLAHA